MILSVCAVLLLNTLWRSSASIAGLTYMDNFDFEERYKNINECNPLYWHPLHLPDKCVEIFETAMLSRIKSNIPIRLVEERRGEIMEISSPYIVSPSYGEEIFQAPITPEISNYGHPFGKMLELLSRDVKDHPRAPTVGFLPNVGLVALYQQPISRKSEKMIKKLATAYAPDISYNEPPYSPISANMPWRKTKSHQNDVMLLAGNKSKKRPKILKGKIKKGSIVAKLKKKNYK